MDYRVVHRTDYHYDDDVTASYAQAHLLPRDVPGRQRALATLTVDPAPSDLRERLDVYGNRTVYFAVLWPHTRLTVTSTSEVEVSGPGAPPPGPAWEAVRNRFAQELDADTVDAIEFTLESPHISMSAPLTTYAGVSFPPGRPVVEAALDLMHRIHVDFGYEPGSTSLSTTLDALLEKRQGVCQDFAHLLVGALRAKGLAARYVSGYVETTPPPGRARLQGADASHAWASLYVPEHGWVDLDPTNDSLVDERFVITAWGRDYSDVAPLTGVIFTDAKETTMSVAVDVVRR